MLRRTLLNTSFAMMAASVAFVSLPAKAAQPNDVLKHYAALGHAKFEDALTTAKALDKAVDALLAKPSEETLKDCASAWLAARPPYLQAEVYRSAIRSLTNGKARSTPGRWTKA